MSDDNKKIVFRGCTFVLGVVLLALCYNTLLLPNNLVVGGMSGLAIVLQKLFNVNATLFIYISSFILIIISYIFLGKESTSNTVVGSILYPVMITITKPIANVILNHLDVNEFIVIVCLAGFFYGIANGLIYKMNFTTGGGDVIMQLISKYFKISTARANFIYSAIIIGLSGCVFGISSFIYALIILVVSNALIDKIIVGISNNKVFFIYSKKLDEIKDLIHNEYRSSFTTLPTKSSLFHKRSEILMVVISNRDHYAFKNQVLAIDPNAFFVINSCYEVNGGTRHKKYSFFE